MSIDLRNIEAHLVRRLKEGDKVAFGMLYDRLCGRVWNFVYSLLFDKSFADDITQNVFLKLWEKRRYIDETRNIRSYLFSIARHYVYKQTERMVLKDRYSEFLQNSWLETDNTTSEELDALFMSDYVRRIINGLPLSRRQIFIMSRIRGMSNEEIATALGISRKTVETQLYRAMKYIKIFRRKI